MRNSLKSYEPGTVHRISYDPENPTQVDINIAYNWETFRPPVFTALLAVFLISVGVGVYRWSYGGFISPQQR